MVRICLLISLALGYATATSPPIPIPTIDDDFNVALNILPKLAPFFGVGKTCELILEKILDSKNEIVNGLRHKVMELKISSTCGSETKICTGIHVEAPLPCDKCEKIVDMSEIQCIPDFIVDPGFILGGFREIDNPSSVPVIRKVAQEATKFLYGHFNTSSPCPIVLKEITRARQQAVMGFNYEFELEVETNGADFECEHVVKICRNVKMHEPIAENCPHKEPSCVLPVNLEDVTCQPIGMLFHEAMLLGGYSKRDVTDEEITGVARNIAPKIMSSFGAFPTCVFEPKRVVEAKSQVVAGTNFLLDVEFSASGDNCENEVKVCRNIKIFRPLPYACADETECLELSETENIECTPSERDEFNQKLSDEAVKFVYHLFNVEKPCLVEVKGHTISTNDDVSFDVALRVQTKEGQFGCDLVFKSCKNIHLRKLSDATCPYDNRPCVIPVRLGEASCVNAF